LERREGQAARLEQELPREGRPRNLPEVPKFSASDPDFSEIFYEGRDSKVISLVGTMLAYR
jgi:hypothetical protein